MNVYYQNDLDDEEIEDFTTSFSKNLKESDGSEDVKSTEGGSLRDQFLAVGTSEEVNQYLDSLKQDLKINGPETYEGWTKSDFVEDFKNYIADKGLEEDTPGFGVGGSHKDNPIINAVEKGISKIGKYAKKFDKFMEPYGKAAAGSMRENEESTNFDERWQESEDPELLDRLDNLANTSDFKELQDLLRIVGSEWMNEDFTKEEIKSMLNFLVDEI
jgi:hypothetical protein